MARNAMVGKSVATSSATSVARARQDNRPVFSIEEWANQIRNVWAKSATNTLELARTVDRARHSLHYGAWARMWASRQIPFSKRKADKLVSIGRHLGGLDENNCAHLPTRWSILYCLSLLGAATVERCLNEGTIHPGLTLREAKELVAKFRGRPRPAQSSGFRVRQRLKRFGEFVHRTLSEWPPADREWARTELVRLIGQIESLPEPEPVQDFLPGRSCRFPILAINESSSVMRGASKHNL